MAKSKFKETQRYQHWEVIALLAILSMGTAIRIISTAFSADYATENVWAGILLLISLLLFLAFFVMFRMTVKVNAKGINYSMFPWSASRHKIKWKDVHSFEIVELPEQAAFSGWSVQYGTLTRGWNMGNRRGLRLDLHNGECHFLGINNIEALKKTLAAIDTQKKG